MRLFDHPTIYIVCAIILEKSQYVITATRKILFPTSRSPFNLNIWNTYCMHTIYTVTASFFHVHVNTSMPFHLLANQINAIISNK